MTQQHNNLLGGQWLAGAAYSPHISPSNLGDVIGEYTQASATQLDAGVHATHFKRHSQAGMPKSFTPWLKPPTRWLDCTFQANHHPSAEPGDLR